MPNPSTTSSPYPLPEEIRNLLAGKERGEGGGQRGGGGGEETASRWGQKHSASLPSLPMLPMSPGQWEQDWEWGRGGSEREWACVEIWFEDGGEALRDGLH